ncbi:nucleotidyltransferase domain-containing protein [Saccharopolyspora erythraea]|uniref:nucleotidyltransferase domain-containing protein n=1 Tax=Saccharopolyspora erythraea TaxID=1836 RepID=UPI001BA6F806|nr:nucleotidyltransferase domain-containing protein [Saccharopolyspora erythraea]QUH01729.1 nucleotidyltransferase domain-containing protein [Saccharopolyspora erythraea]
MDLGDDEFRDHIADTLAGLPGVEAVALGGSRASGTHRADSDWDFAIYYRGEFDPQDLRAVGWPGEISPIGGWGGGVFNGGAWLEVDCRQIDVHYRDLDDVEHQLAEARAGRFHVESLMFHLAGIPSYLVAAELAINRTLRGELEKPEYPDALRKAAAPRWWDSAQLTLGYARAAYAEHGHLAETVGAIGQAACQAAHAALADRGEWITNEKKLLERAGLREVDGLVAGVTTEPESLTKAVDDALELFNDVVAAD